MMPAGPEAGDAMFPGQGQWIDIPEELHAEFAQVRKGDRMAALMEQLKTAARRSGDGRPVFTDGPVESLARTNRVSIGLSYNEGPNDSFPGAPTPCWYLSISEYVPGAGYQAASEVDLIAWVMAGFPTVTRFAEYTMATAVARHAQCRSNPAGFQRGACGRLARWRMAAAP